MFAAAHFPAMAALLLANSHLSPVVLSLTQLGRNVFVAEGLLPICGVASFSL